MISEIICELQTLLLHGWKWRWVLFKCKLCLRGEVPFVKKSFSFIYWIMTLDWVMVCLSLNFTDIEAYFAWILILFKFQVYFYLFTLLYWHLRIFILTLRKVFVITWILSIRLLMHQISGEVPKNNPINLMKRWKNKVLNKNLLLIEVHEIEGFKSFLSIKEF